MKKLRKVVVLLLALNLIAMSGMVAYADECAHKPSGPIITPPTCSQDGKVEIKCGMCGEVIKSSIINKLKHSISKDTLKVIKEKTCDQDGESTGICKLCGEEVTVITERGHVPGEKVMTKKPTLDEPGEYTRTCTECGECIESETIPQLTSEDLVSVNVIIYVYNAIPVMINGVKSYKMDKDSDPEVIQADSTKLDDPYGKLYKDNLIAYSDYNLNLTELLDSNIRVVNSIISGQKNGTLELTDQNSYNFENQYITGNVGAKGNITIKLEAMKWHNFTQVNCIYKSADGKRSRIKDEKFVGLTYEDTTLNEVARYERPVIDGYYYGGFEIGYYQNMGSETGPGEVETIFLSPEKQKEWQFEEDTNGDIIGRNVNFYADKQLFINFIYTLPYSVSYDLNSGNLNGNTEIASVETREGTSVTTISNPTRSGYTFTGWTVTVDNDEVSVPIITDGKFIMPGANVTLTANWSYNSPYVPPTPTDPMGPTDPIDPPDEPDTPDTPDNPDDPGQVDPSGDDDPIVEPSGDSDKTDNETKGVKTGDETMLAIWGALGLIAALGLGGTLVIGRRREE